MATLQVFNNLAQIQPQLLSDYVLKIKKSAECNPNTLCIAAQVLSAVGQINKVLFQLLYLKLSCLCKKIFVFV